MVNADPMFIRKYLVINKADPKRYPNPVTEHDIKLLEQMGANIVIDNVLNTVYITNGKRTRIRRKGTRRIVS